MTRTLVVLEEADTGVVLLLTMALIAVAADISLEEAGVFIV
jgi:hypothetical protein